MSKKISFQKSKNLLSFLSHNSGKAFIDYQNKVEHRIYIPSEEEIYKVSDEELIEFLRSKNITEIYIEAAPKQWIYKLLSNDVKVYILRIKKQRLWRKKYGLRKNHENDAKLLYLLYQENPKLFKQYVKRQLSIDSEIQRYRVLLKEKTRIEIKIKTNSKLGLSTEELKEYKKWLEREASKLLYHLKKRYSNIISRFNDIKGLAGGNLLYFLTLIPEIKSFRSAREFLVYLGLRGVGKHYNNWNREARDTLIRIATRVAVCNKIKFNPKKPNWSLLRKLAVTIYWRLREMEGGESEVGDEDPC